MTALPSLSDVDALLCHRSVKDVHRLLERAEHDLKKNRASLTRLMGDAYPQVLRIVSTACSLQASSSKVAKLLDTLKRSQEELQSILIPHSAPLTNSDEILPELLSDEVQPLECFDAQILECTERLQQWLRVPESWRLALSCCVSVQFGHQSPIFKQEQTYLRLLQAYTDLPRRIVQHLFFGRPLPALFMLCCLAPLSAQLLLSKTAAQRDSPSTFLSVVQRYDFYCVTHQLFKRASERAVQLLTDPLPLLTGKPDIGTPGFFLCGCSLCHPAFSASSFPSTSRLCEALSVLKLCIPCEDQELEQQFRKARTAVLESRIQRFSENVVSLLNTTNSTTTHIDCKLIDSITAPNTELSAWSVPSELQRRAMAIAYQFSTLLHILDTSANTLCFFTQSMKQKWKEKLVLLFASKSLVMTSVNDPCTCNFCQNHKGPPDVLHLWAGGTQPPVPVPSATADFPKGDESQKFPGNARLFAEVWNRPIVELFDKALELLLRPKDLSSSESVQDTPEMLIALSHFWRMVLSITVAYRTYDTARSFEDNLLFWDTEQSEITQQRSSSSDESGASSPLFSGFSDSALCNSWNASCSRYRNAMPHVKGKQALFPKLWPSIATGPLLENLHISWEKACLDLAYRVTLNSVLQQINVPLEQEEKTDLSHVVSRIMDLDQLVKRLLRLIPTIGEAPFSACLPPSSIDEQICDAPSKALSNVLLSPRNKHVIDALFEAHRQVIPSANAAQRLCSNMEMQRRARPERIVPIHERVVLPVLLLHCLGDANSGSASLSERLPTLSNIAVTVVADLSFDSTRRTHQDILSNVRTTAQAYFNVYWEKLLTTELEQLRTSLKNYLSHPAELSLVPVRQAVGADNSLVTFSNSVAHTPSHTGPSLSDTADIVSRNQSFQSVARPPLKVGPEPQTSYSASHRHWAPKTPTGDLCRLLFVSSHRCHCLLEFYEKHFSSVVPEKVWKAFKEDVVYGLVRYLETSLSSLYAKAFWLHNNETASNSITVYHAAQNVQYLLPAAFIDVQTTVWLELCFLGNSYQGPRARCGGALLDITVFDLLSSQAPAAALRNVVMRLRDLYLRDPVDKILFSYEALRTIALKFLSDHFLLFAPFFRNRVVHPPSLDSLMNKQRSAQYQSSNLLKVEENVNGSEPPVYSIPPPFPLLSGELPTKMIQHPHTAAFNATSTIHSSLATPNALKSPDLGPSLETRSTCQGKNTGRLSHVAAAEFGSSAYRNVSNFSSFLRGHVEGLSSKVSEVMKQRTTTGPNL